MKKPLTDSELSVFAGQLAMILHSGISVIEGISILREDAVSEDAQRILSVIYEKLETTGEFALSMHESGVFPDYFLKMTEIGERSGTLEEVLDSLADYYDRQASLMQSIRDSLTYPLILLGMLSAVLIVLMTQVMPVFEEVFAQLGIEMTGISAAIFRISHTMQAVSILLLVLVVALILGCIVGLRVPKGKAAIFSVLIHVPLVRTVSSLLACSHFSAALSLALHSGLDIDESFALAADLTQQEAFLQKRKAAEALIEQGTEFETALRESGIFTGLNARMMSIGFRTGSAEDALKKISADTQNEAEEQIQRAVNALEPTLTAILSILTGLILVSVMLPLLGVMANIG